MLIKGNMEMKILKDQHSEITTINILVFSMRFYLVAIVATPIYLFFKSFYISYIYIFYQYGIIIVYSFRDSIYYKHFQLSKFS